MIILKLGGSLITEKGGRFSARRNVLGRLAGEIKESGIKDIVIVHGGGSFGHPIAAEYGLGEGLENKEQVKGVALTKIAMSTLDQMVLNTLTMAEVPAVAVPPSAFVLCKKGRISRLDPEVVKGFLEIGMVPVLFGDVVLDSARGVCILSGDQIVSHLAERLGAERVILCADVDGVFDRDPKKNEGATLIKEIGPSNYREVLSGLEVVEGDVTGGVKGKVSELLELGKKGIASQVINGLTAGRLKSALSGREVTGTIIRSGDYE